MRPATKAENNESTFDTIKNALDEALEALELKYASAVFLEHHTDVFASAKGGGRCLVGW